MPRKVKRMSWKNRPIRAEPRNGTIPYKDIQRAVRKVSENRVKTSIKKKRQSRTKDLRLFWQAPTHIQIPRILERSFIFFEDIAIRKRICKGCRKDIKKGDQCLSYDGTGHFDHPVKFSICKKCAGDYLSSFANLCDTMLKNLGQERKETIYNFKEIIKGKTNKRMAIIAHE